MKAVGFKVNQVLSEFQLTITRKEMIKSGVVSGS